MQQFSSLLPWHLFRAQQVSGVFPPIIRGSMTAVASSGFTFVSWWQSCESTKVKPESVAAVIELLMIDGKTHETCWAVNKRQDNKLENCCIWLVIYLKFHFSVKKPPPFVPIPLTGGKNSAFKFFTSAFRDYTYVCLIVCPCILLSHPSYFPLFDHKGWKRE